MSSLIRNYRLCSLVELPEVEYRVTGLWPTYSPVPAFAELKDELGNVARIDSISGLLIPNPMRPMQSSRNLSLAAGEHLLTTTVALPWQSLHGPGHVRFRVNGVSLRDGRLLSGFPLRCYDPSVPALPHLDEPPLLSMYPPNIFDRGQDIVHAEIISRLYVDFASALDYVSTFFGPGHRMSGVPISDVPGSGCLWLGTPWRNYLWVTGTTTDPQLREQRDAFEVGPRDYAGVDTGDIYWRGAALVSNMLDVAVPDMRLPWTFCGHSMGGAIIHVHVCRMVSFGVLAAPMVDVLTFGAPRGTGIRGRQILDRLSIRRIVGDGDIVCYLPPKRRELGPLGVITTQAIIENFGKWYHPYGVTFLTQGGGLLEGQEPLPLIELMAVLMSYWFAVGPPPVTDAHAITEYARRLRLLL